MRKLSEALRALADPKRAELSLRFFKTGPGEYGEGDHFWGLNVPQVRRIAKEYKELNLEQLASSLSSEIHEERLAALLILTEQFKKSDGARKKQIYEFYLSHTHFINNWDLVDSSAPYIVGAYLFERPKQKLFSLAESESLWERRIAIISTLYFIKNGHAETTLLLAEKLLNDHQDLIHKAVGWSLRELEKKFGKAAVIPFLKIHYAKLPRTTLRYAIEHFPESERKRWLKGDLEGL